MDHLEGVPGRRGVEAFAARRVAHYDGPHSELLEILVGQTVADRRNPGAALEEAFAELLVVP
jgi:hypothetical protein